MNSLRAILIASLSFVLLFLGQTYAADKTFSPGNPDYVKKTDSKKGKMKNVSFNASEKSFVGACTGGGISGKVTDAYGIEIPGVHVHVYDVTGNLVNYATTVGDGSYIVFDLASGSYKVQFHTYDPFSSIDSIYASEWYNNRTVFNAAHSVVVNAPNVTSGINAMLTQGGSISGKVADLNGLPPEDFVRVEVYDSSGWKVNDAVTDIDDGTYIVKGLATGSYKVRFNATYLESYASQWYGNKIDFDTANTIVVLAPGETPGINAQLTVGGGISGRVTGVGGAGLANVVVFVYDSDGYSVKDVLSDWDGTYKVTGLATGKYKIRFDTEYNSGYLGKWYHNKTTEDEADTVSVTAPHITKGIKEQLDMEGSISGKITDLSGTGIGGIHVYVYDTGGNNVNEATTGPDGTYTVAGLTAGSYKVHFDAGYSSYASQWYNNKNEFDTADAVAVATANVTADINATLTARGGISGKVNDAAGVGIYNVVVVAVDACGNNVNEATTGPDGTYTVAGLGTGSYRVQFYAGYSPTYAFQWYDNKPTEASANAVTVSAPHVTSGINAKLAVGGGISGKVTNSGGAAIADICVEVYDTDGNWVNENLTGEGGSYIVISLGTSSYKLKFYSCGSAYTSEWYNNKSSFDAADTVAVTAPNIISGIDAVLAGSVRIMRGGRPVNLYTKLQVAYNASVDGDIIQAPDMVISEAPIFGSDVSIKLEGGYDGSFNYNSGTFTTLRGSLLIKGGTVTIENFIIR
jgi:hypothetical protein